MHRLTNHRLLQRVIFLKVATAPPQQEKEYTMNSDLHTYVTHLVIVMVVTMILVQTLFHFRKATRQLIISGSSKAIAWTLDRGNRLLHVMLMSPLKARPGSRQNTPE